jgi:hypothetical protein
VTLRSASVVVSRSLLAALSLAACGHTDVHAVVFRATGAGAGPVPIYLAGQTTPAIATDVALVQAVGHGTESSPELVTQELAARGGQLGCDAVVRVQIQQGISRTHAAGVCVTWAR